MATTPHVSRRSLLTASAATLAGTAVGATPALVSAASAMPGLSPRLAELKREFDAAAAEEMAARSDPSIPGGSDEEWVPAFEAILDIAYEVMCEPAASLADFTFKAAVWDLAIYDPELCSDDMSLPGWMDRAHYRLLNEARQLLAAMAEAA